MAIKFSFFAYGILAVCALALVLAFTSSETGQTGLSSSFFNLAVLIIVVFFIYMFVRVFKR